MSASVQLWHLIHLMNGRKWECCYIWTGRLSTQQLQWKRTNHWTPRQPVRAASRVASFSRSCTLTGEQCQRGMSSQQLCGWLRLSENYHDSRPTSLEGLGKCWKHGRMSGEWSISAKWRLQSDKFSTRVTATELELFASCWVKGRNVQALRRNALLLLLLFHLIIIIIISALFLRKMAEGHTHCRPKAWCITGISLETVKSSRACLQLVMQQLYFHNYYDQLSTSMNHQQQMFTV